MLLSDTFKTAYAGVSANPSRSLLTMLGIIIGVCSVVLMTGIGKSMEGVILGQISSLGAKSMVIFPGSGPEGGAGQVQAGFDSLTLDDLEALEQLTSITSLAPIIFVPGEVQYGRELSSATVLGTRPTFFRNQNIEIDQGRLLTSVDEEGAKFVTVLGPDVATDLFPGGNPLNKRIKVAGRTFTVVGVHKPLGSQFFQNADERMYVPFKTAKAITGQKHLSYMTMQAASSFDLAFADVKSLLRQRHQIDNPEDDPDEDDFVVRSSQQAQEILGTVSLSLTVFITFIAAISLVVGGIGIMNIMLVAVTERTREIGLRKALGATRSNILLQFLIESMMLTVIGGFIGMFIGVFLAYFIALAAHKFLSTYLFAISPVAMVVALFTAAITGLVFGIYPAKRAAELSPMQALRYE